MADIIKKIGILGDSGTGKNTYFKKVCKSPFDKVANANGRKFTDMIGVTVGKYETEFEYRDEPVSLAILAWDMTGQKEFNIFRQEYCKYADGAIIVSRSDRTESIKNAYKWVDELYKNAGKVPVAFVVNKVAGHPVSAANEWFIENTVKEYSNNAEIYYLNFKRCKPKTLSKPLEDLGKLLVGGCEASLWDEPG